MHNVITTANVPIKVWSPLDQVESGAIDQLTNTANLPCVFHHVAVMPDVHVGKGATVGSVVATKGAIVPAAVGVDIGCGMHAIRLPLTILDLPRNLHKLRQSIEAAIPVGPTSHKEPVTKWSGIEYFGYLPRLVQDRKDNAMRQLGTLGGGNHFIEMCLDASDDVWVVLHSGSRNIGKEIAEVHIDNARGIMRDYFIKLPDPDLAYLVEGTMEFDAYWRDLQWAQAYALENRATMARVLLNVLRRELHMPELCPLETLDCHHNYAEREHHFGSNVIVTRKGAVRARVGDMGIIPGSMGARSYIVRGLGHPESFHSCSHGAGRRMSRGKAKAHFTVKDLAAQTAGVECRKDDGVLDEIPGAYKDIDDVMANQLDLVEIVATLKQILCVKG